jgi:hypothetical protein
MNYQLDENRSELESLEAFLISNPDLDKLNSMLEQFNIFESIGIVRHELRHSDFLAFLLNPHEVHGLGDIVVKRLLESVLSVEGGSESPISAVEIALWDLDTISVQREWRNIDIVLTDEGHKMVIIIENKLDTSEHSNQLRRYWRSVHDAYPDWRMIGLYLTVDGDAPSDERYIALNYELIYDIVDEVVEMRSSSLGPDIKLALTHYTQLLRRHVMPDSDIAELCRRIYRKHQKALDLIYEHRPDLQIEIRDLLIDMIESEPGMQLDHSSKSSVRFLPHDLDLPLFQAGEGWTPTGRMLLFEFNNRANRLTLRLYIGPGPQEIRQQLFDVALQNCPPFDISRKGKPMARKWQNIYRMSVLQAEDYADAIMEDLAPKIEKRWNEFLMNKLPALSEIIKNEDW